MSNQFNEGSDILVRAFVSIPGSVAALSVSDVDPLLGIDLAVYDGSVLVYSLTGLAAVGMFFPLSSWSYDDRGYNFQYSISGGAFDAIGGKTYRIEFTIHTINFGNISVDVDAACKGRLSA